MQPANQFVRNKAKDQPLCVEITDGTRNQYVTLYPGTLRIAEGWRVKDGEFAKYPRQLVDVTEVESKRRENERAAKNVRLAERAKLRARAGIELSVTAN